MQRRGIGLVEGPTTLAQLFVPFVGVGLGFGMAAAILGGLTG